MTIGTFGKQDELLFEIQLKSNEGLLLAVDALLDTGFSDWLVIDKQDIEALDWIYVGERIMAMVRGEAKFDIYVGSVIMNGEELEIPVYAGEGISDILLGRQWLKTRRLTADIAADILTLEDSSTAFS